MVSIVVPVYNAEKTLRVCLNSIIENTYKDYEIILINDGSQDNSPKIIDEYKKNTQKLLRHTLKKMVVLPLQEIMA